MHYSNAVILTYIEYTFLSGGEMCGITSMLTISLNQWLIFSMFSSKHLKVLFLQIKLMNTKALTHRHHATTPVWGTTLWEELLPVKGVAWQADPIKSSPAWKVVRIPEPQHSSPGSHSVCTLWPRSLPSCFQDLVDAINPKIGVQCLNAPQVAKVLILLLLPFCDQVLSA